MTQARQSAATAVVVVNLGTPEAPTAPAVRRYLAEFLSDRRVVSLPPLLWQPLLRGVILPLRAPKVAPKYASVWLDGGSPLAVYTRQLAAAMQQELPDLQVLDAMRYGEPSLARLLQRLRDEGLQRVLVLPLYPQYSTTTTASVGDVVARADGLALRMVDEYHLDDGWVAAVAQSVRDHRAANGAGEHLLFSFHGLPQRVADAGDPYPRQCEASARAIAAALGLPDDAWTLAYQSRFGRERWLEPATDTTLEALAARGIRTVDVIAPGFAADCLETLEEVSIMLAEQFAERGGTLRYIPCLNDSPAHARALAAVARRALDQWA
ncbi:MAG: ferrochelatase [Lysobacter sp.]|uniref:Ferrochelatase n=1 Tax=Novilysobacter luteus TaxID=2822368 RepID=A0ABM8UBZ8_9GAMM|nr:ferrochelatase [Lysobacter luteus]MDV3256068.1 ferrochelatase [Lysobacter sp.]MDV5982064.1 ferrochelatase [Lysobacter sp.]CAG4967782.1 Ferrochelatase [Lysobacter luteus]